MMISLEWLNRYLDRPVDADEADRVLTAVGFPLEGREPFHDDEVLDSTDAEFLRSRYHALGDHWKQKDPQAFTFDEDELAEAVDEEAEERHARDHRSGLAAIGERVGDVIYSASRKDGTAADVI